MKKTSFLCILVLMFIGVSSCTNEENNLDQNKVDSSIKTRAVYTFPTVSQILASTVVQNAMEAAWRQMISTASASGRSEYGFYIYYNHNNGSYYVGNTVAGPVNSGCAGTNSSISLGRVTSNIDVCAFFHCHTTLQYCPSTDSRRTGPSSSDTSFANNNNLPGIVYDYSSSTIYGGHNSNDNYTSYTFGPSQRPDMYY